jgi:hypothetical protein
MTFQILFEVSDQSHPPNDQSSRELYFLYELPELEDSAFQDTDLAVSSFNPSVVKIKSEMMKSECADRRRRSEEEVDHPVIPFSPVPPISPVHHCPSDENSGPEKDDD